MFRLAASVALRLVVGLVFHFQLLLASVKVYAALLKVLLILPALVSAKSFCGVSATRKDLANFLASTLLTDSAMATQLFFLSKALPIPLASALVKFSHGLLEMRRDLASALPTVVAMGTQPSFLSMLSCDDACVEPVSVSRKSF